MIDWILLGCVFLFVVASVSAMFVWFNGTDPRIERRLASDDEEVPFEKDSLLLGEITEPLSRLRETWTALLGPFRRRFDRLILPVGFVAGESRTAELGLLFRALGDLADGNSNGVPLAGARSNQLLQEIQAFADIFGEYFRSKEESETAVRRNSRE